MSVRFIARAVMSSRTASNRASFDQGVRASGGSEPSDPKKVAELVRHLLDLDEPPVRLLVGEDAIDYVGATERAQAASDEKWQHLTRSVSFDR
jgi:hypothetical protein